MRKRMHLRRGQRLLLRLKRSASALTWPRARSASVGRRRPRYSSKCVLGRLVIVLRPAPFTFYVVVPTYSQAVPMVLADRDVIGLAQTGSGKTGAFALPILQALLNKPQAFHTLVLSPTRELAIQIAQQFEALGAGIGVRALVLASGDWGGVEGGEIGNQTW